MVDSMYFPSRYWLRYCVLEQPRGEPSGIDRPHQLPHQPSQSTTDLKASDSNACDPLFVQRDLANPEPGTWLRNEARSREIGAWIFGREGWRNLLESLRNSRRRIRFSRSSTRIKTKVMVSARSVLSCYRSFLVQREDHCRSTQ
jgi:hypothetical protein